jgi:predicted N-acyltransferase
MSETIELEVGALYAQQHERFAKELGDQYEERARKQFEDFLHQMNQRVERQNEQARVAQQDEGLELSEEDIEDISDEADED